MNVRGTVLGLSSRLSRVGVVVLLAGPTRDSAILGVAIGAHHGLHRVRDVAIALLLLMLSLLDGEDVLAWRSGRSGKAVGGLGMVGVKALAVVEGGELVVGSVQAVEILLKEQTGNVSTPHGGESIVIKHGGSKCGLWGAEGAWWLIE